MINIRLVREEDLDILAEIYKDLYGNSVLEEDWSVEKSKALFKFYYTLQTDLFLVAETDGSVTLNTEEDIEKFLYQIQARNRMNKIIEMSGFELKDDLNSAETEEERFNVYHRYNEILKEKNDTNSQVRFTSMNFNHIKWNSDSPGRIEIRIFNSSIQPEIIFQNLLLVGKLF